MNMIAPIASAVIMYMIDHIKSIIGRICSINASAMSDNLQIFEVSK